MMTLCISRTINDITNDINEIKNKISRIETDTENVNDIMHKYNELTEKCLKSADIMKSLQDDIEELTVALNKRNRHYKLTENYFVTYMKYSFKKILEFRQFKVKTFLSVFIHNKGKCCRV